MTQMMLRAVQVLKAGSWQAAPVDRITLSYDERHRRRLRFLADAGTEFLLDLPRTTVLLGGDGLRLEDGRVILVAAADEPLLEITAADQTSWPDWPGISAIAICRRKLSPGAF